MQIKKKGFTLVELALAIASISILLLTVTYVINGITVSYRKGLSIKKINSFGRDITEELTTTIQSSPAASYAGLCNALYDTSESGRKAHADCIADEAYKLFYQEYKFDINANGTEVSQAPTFGVFCGGKYSYIWNTGYTIDSGNIYGSTNSPVPKATLRYRTSEGNVVEKSTFRLLKFPDQSHYLCSVNIANDYASESLNYRDMSTEVIFDISIRPGSDTPYSLSEEPIELITTSEMGGLAFYDFVIKRPAQEKYSKRLFFSGYFVLATINSGVSLMTNGNYCVPPPNVETSIDYCSINKFNFAARAIGG